VRISGLVLIGSGRNTRTPSAAGSGCIQVSAQVRRSRSHGTEKSSGKRDSAPPISRRRDR
jgi:hypothetical protein